MKREARLGDVQHFGWLLLSRKHLASLSQKSMGCVY
jgi:hypothetical protein